MIAQIKHTVDSLPYHLLVALATSWLLLDLKLLPAPLILATEKTIQAIGYTRALQSSRWLEFGPKSVSVDPGVIMNPVIIFQGPECKVGANIIGS